MKRVTNVGNGSMNRVGGVGRTNALSARLLEEGDGMQKGHLHAPASFTILMDYRTRKKTVL